MNPAVRAYMAEIGAKGGRVVTPAKLASLARVRAARKVKGEKLKEQQSKQ